MNSVAERTLGFGNTEERRGGYVNCGFREEFQFYPLVRQQGIPFFETLLSKSDSASFALSIIFSTLLTKRKSVYFMYKVIAVALCRVL
jgi:hypothetical protein